MRYQEFAESSMCPECGGVSFSDLMLAEKQDACYHKVKSRYKVWPSAYASGALVQCRKKGAANWGNKSKNESMAEGSGDGYYYLQGGIERSKKFASEAEAMAHSKRFFQLARVRRVTLKYKEPGQPAVVVKEFTFKDPEPPKSQMSWGDFYLQGKKQGVEEGKYKCTCHPGDADPDCPVHGLEPMDVGDALDVKKGVAEANPNQQLALYKPDSKTYRGQPVPGSDTVDPDDITARRRRADSFSHRDVDKSQTAHDPEQTAHQDQLKRMFDRMLQDLPPRMKQFVYLRYHHDMTLDQVAQRLGIATETARQIEAKMLRKLKGKHGDELRKATGATEPAPTAVQITNKDAYAQGQADAQRGVRYNSEKFLPRDKESYRLGYLAGYKK